MYPAKLERSPSWASRISIVLLIVFSLFCFFISTLDNLFTYEYNYSGYYSSNYEFTTQEPLWFFTATLADLPGLLAQLLVLVYALFLARKPKALILMAMSFFFLMLYYFMQPFPRIVAAMADGYFESLDSLENIWHFILEYLQYYSFNIIIVPILILGIIGAFTGYSHKAFVCIPVSMLMVGPLQGMLTSLYNVEWYIEDERFLYLFTIPADIYGRLAFFIALLILGLVVTQPNAFSSRKRYSEAVNDFE